MKHLLLIVVFLSCLYGFNSTQYVEDNWYNEYDQSPETVRIRDTQIEDVEDSLPPESQEQKTIDNNKKTTLNQKSVTPLNVEYFEPYFEHQDIKLSCPPLREYYQGKVIVLSDGSDYRSGSITCSVYKHPFAMMGMSQSLIAATPLPRLQKIYTKTFYNPSYSRFISEFSESEYSSLDPAAIAATNDYITRLSLSKQALKYKYNNTSSQFSPIFDNQTAIDGDITYLNLSDLMDAVMVFNTSIIDLEETVQTGSLTLNDGFRLIYEDEYLNDQKQERKQKLADFTKEVNDQFSFFPKFFDQTTQSDLDLSQNNMVLLFGDGLNMMFQWVIKYNFIFSDVLIILLPFIVGVAGINIGKFYMESRGRDSDKKNLKWKITSVVGTSLTILILSIPSETQVQDSSGQKYEVGISTFQEYTSFISMITNEIADLATESIIDVSTNAMFGDVTSSVESIRATVRQKSRLEKEKIELKKYNDICIDIYATEVLVRDNPDFFKHNDSNLNPFVPDSYLVTKGDVLSPYNRTNLNGYVKNDLINQEQLSLTSCFNSRNEFNNISRSIQFLNKKIDAFNSLQNKEAVFGQKQLVSEKLWEDYFELGYLAAPYIQVVESYVRITELPAKKAEEWYLIMTSLDLKKVGGFFVENVVWYTQVGGPIQDIVKFIAEIFTDVALGFIPFGIGDNLSSISSSLVGVSAAMMAVDLLDEMIPAIRGLFIWGVASIMMSLFFISKFVAFWLIPFAILYALVQQSLEKTIKFGTKVIIVFINPIVLIFVLFVSTFIMDFYSNYIYFGIDQMVDDLTMSGGGIEFVAAHILKSIAKFLALIIEFIVAFLLITKGTKAITNFFEIQTNDLADSISDGIASVVQNKVVK